MLLEKNFEDIISKYPELIEDGLTLQGRQVTLYGRRMDLLFEDKFRRKLIVELKIGPIKDVHIGQVLSYEGMLLSAEDPTIRVMLIGNRVPPNIQRSLDHHGIAWREITLSFLMEFLKKRNDEEYLNLFELNEPVSIKKFSKTEPEWQVYRIQAKPEQAIVNADDLVTRIKSSESYSNFRKILPMKIRNEEKAKEILNANIGKLNHSHLKEIIDLVDEPYPYIKNGKVVKGPWFGRLLKSNTVYFYDENVDKLNIWFNILTNSSMPIENRIELLLNEPNKIRGLSVGFITLMLYIQDKENYLIWFEGQHEALNLFYPDLVKYTGTSDQYFSFNNLAKEFAKKYCFDHTELDWIFSTGIHSCDNISSMTIFQQIKEVLKDKTGMIVKSSEVIEMLRSGFGTNPSSVMLSDYCYNRFNDGIKFTKHIFEYLDSNSYKYLGENYPYNGNIIHKPKGQEIEKIVGEWKNGIKLLGSTSEIWIGLDQSKYTIKQVFENQKVPDFIERITFAFHTKLSEQLSRRNLNWFARTHIFGISYFCNDQKTFLWVNIYQKFISIKYFTGKSLIKGIIKANWVTGDDNMGSEPYRVMDEASISQAVQFAINAYEIAVNWKI
jgi:hypothetical protein